MQIQDFFVNLNVLPAQGYEKTYTLGDDFWQLFENSLIPKGQVEAKVSVEPKAHSFDLQIEVNGVVQIPCHRCLDDVDIRVERHDYFIVKLGDEDDYGEESITIDRNDGMLDVATLIYEASALSLPLVVKHQDGQCNSEMMKILEDLAPAGDFE